MRRTKLAQRLGPVLGLDDLVAILCAGDTYLSSGSRIPVHDEYLAGGLGDADHAKNTNRSEGLLADVAFQPPNAASSLLLQGDQARTGLREDELPRAGVVDLRSSKAFLELPQSMPRVIRPASCRRNAPKVVVGKSCLGAATNRPPV